MSCMKRDASPGSVHDAGCLGWCAGKAQGDGMGRLGGRRVQDGEHVIFFKKEKKNK